VSARDDNGLPLLPVPVVIDVHVGDRGDGEDWRLEAMARVEPRRLVEAVRAAVNAVLDAATPVEDPVEDAVVKPVPKGRRFDAQAARERAARAI
jgi:hypothetical protein